MPSHQIVKTNNAFADLSGYYRKNQKPEFEYFSFPFSETDLSKVEAVVDSDIIHLHWISDSFIDYKNVFSLNKKFVWTLHDMNPFTGGCHHSDGCNKFKNNCNYCYQLEGTVDEYVSGKILNYKKEALAKLTDDQLVIVTPSKWLSDLSKQSSIFKRFVHVVIPNIINLPVSGANRDVSRLRLGIKNDEIALLFVAHGLDNPRKGISALITAIEGMEKKEDLKIITVGAEGMKINGVNCTNLGFVKDNSKLAEAYVAADVFMLPSLAENFPNTIVESLLCGTPVIASAVGGIPEQITKENGILVQSNSAEEWVKAINSFIKEKESFNRDKIKTSAKQKYDTAKVLSDYVSLYKSFK